MAILNKTQLEAVNVMTGVFTGRSPKDKYIVEDSVTKDTIWWGDVNFKFDAKINIFFLMCKL